MAINNIETAVKYSGELDKAFTQKSVVGFFADNNLREKFVGAKTVMIPDVDFVGLVNYDRDGGFARSKTTVANSAFTMQMDRARSIMIDREDMDESGVTELAGKVLGEFVRTKAVPECDAYCLSKLAGLANENDNVHVATTTEMGKPFNLLTSIVQKVCEVVGYDEPLVCFVDGTMYAALQNDATFNKQVVVSDFKKGEISLKVKSVDGVPIIPVSSERMKSFYTFADGSDENVGGFSYAADVPSIHMLVMPKKGASLVKKTEKLRIFTPEQNQDADAYKFDYRIYYDIFVKKSAIKAIQCIASAAVTTPEYATKDKYSETEE